MSNPDMRILQVTARYPPQSGGVESQVQHLVRRMRSLGHDIQVLTSNTTAVGSRLEDDVLVLRLPILFKLYQSPFCPSLPFTSTRKVDIVHVHIPPRSFAFSALFHKFKHQCSSVLSFHLLLEDSPSYVSALSKMQYSIAIKAIFSLYDRIVVPTPDYQHLLIHRFKVPKQKVKVIANGVDLKFLSSEEYRREELKKQLGFDLKKVVMFIGRFDAQGLRQKGVFTLIKAIPSVIKVLDNVLFVFGGGGEMLDHVKEFVAKQGLGPYTKFLGKFPEEKKPSLLASADVLVLPSNYESFGLVLCEAMAMKTPVISTRIRAVTNVVQDGQNGLLVEPMNSGQLSQAIINILEDEKAAERLAFNGRKTVEELYDINNTVQKTLELYEDLLRQKF